LSLCLQSIKDQDYPKDKVEVIIVDGGSIDKTIEIANHFNARIVVRECYQQDQESRRAVGLFNARNEILAYIDSDNILPHKKWFKTMTKPFLENKNIIATQPLRYTYDKKYSLLNRYFALFGVNDPVPYYLNKRDRLSWAEKSWKLLGDSKDMGYYYLVKFDQENVPTLGCNGFLIRKTILLKAKCEPPNFGHIDVNHDLIKLGYNTYGIVKDDIIHLTGNTFFNFLRKRMRYMIQYYLNDRFVRRYQLYSSTKDKQKLALFIFNSLTLLKTTSDSIKGYKKIPDIAWFLHPIMCWCILFVYGFPIIIQNAHVYR
jgi:glycosyltransferase involved in cell wall biosynthesis